MSKDLQEYEKMEKIVMAHGSGGKSGEELMSNIFGRYFKNEILDKMEDAAVLSVNGKIAVSTDSFVITPLEFKGGNIGKLCVCGTVNDLLMMGSVPKYITCGFILEEGLDIALLDKLVRSMAETAEKAGVLIVAGDTKVVEGNGGLYINTTGIGVIPEGRDVSAANCRPGDAVILSGTLGDHHACILSARMGIENNITSDCGLLQDIQKGLFDGGINVKTMRDVTRGGLGTILNEIAGMSDCAIELNEEDIPVSDDVRGLCGILGLDPVYMANEGKMIAVVPGDQEEKALEIVRNTEKGRDARIIGHITEGSGVSMKTRLGGRRVVDVLYGEGLPRIC